MLILLCVHMSLQEQTTVQDNATGMVEEAEELTDALRTQVLFAREYLKGVSIGPKQVKIDPRHVEVLSR